MSIHPDHPINHDDGALTADRPTLPVMLTPFIGRQREVSELCHKLSTTRGLSLVGTGGCGKTRLAHRVAQAVGANFADVICWVELAAIHDPLFVLPAVARQLNMVAQPETPLLTQLIAKLAHGQWLLVLDNCEHLLAACAELVEMLLRSTAIQVMATSREPLGVTGEMLYPVPPFTLPLRQQPLEAIAATDAIQFFVARAHSIQPAFALTAENAEGVADLCRQLDGMPLAIELACARLNVLSVPQIAERLGQRLDLLVATPRSDPRHRTLRAAIDWSYDLLTPAEQRLLQRLSVFAGGFTLNTVEAACAWGELERPQVLELLASLVNKSLVVVETIQAREARYRLLETLRQYASEKLAASGQWAETQDRYLEAFLGFAEEIVPKLHQQYQQLWMHWLESEHDNLRSALAWALESGRFEAGLRIANALTHFWELRSYVQEGLTWFERLLAEMEEEISLPVHIYALTYAAFLASFLSDKVKPLTYGQQAVALAEEAGEAGAPLLLGEAQTHFAQSMRLLRQLDATSDLAGPLQNLGYIALQLGDVTRAAALFQEALTIHQSEQNRRGMAESLLGFGALAIQQAAPAAGVRLLAAAEAIGWRRLKSSWAITRQVFDHALARACRSLSAAELQAAQEAGRLLSLAEALAYAQNLPGLATPVPARQETPDDLTERERQVVVLIALGKSNREIADQLVLSKRTVEKHIANILAKLAVSNRAQIVRWAIDHGPI